MLAFFRRVLSSWMAVALLALVMLAFIVTGVGTPGGGLIGGTSADNVAVVGNRPITIDMLSQRAAAELNQARQQQPDLTMPALLDAVGGVGPIVEQYLGASVLSAWAQRHGVTVSERMIDGEIASIPAFAGPTGQFSQGQMNAVLSQQRLSYATLRDGIRDDLLRRQLLTPLDLGVHAPTGLLTPYAALLLAKREGSIGLVPAKVDGLPAPTEADIQAWYKSNIARYTLPERRVLRYAPVNPETVPVPAPTEAEIAAAYKADAAKYAASETRTVSQVVLPDAGAAKAFQAKLAGGAAFAKAAADAGFSPTDIALGSVTRDALAKSASPAVAAAAFALPAGGTTAPIKSDLGYAIVHVEAVKANAGRSLDQVRGEIGEALAKAKRERAVGDLVNRLQDAIGDGASFNELVTRNKLQLLTTPPLTADGRAPGAPAFVPDPTVTALLKVARDVGPDDEPTVEPITQPDRFALFSVASVVPAAPLPLVQVRSQVVADLTTKRAADRAQATARAILAKVKAGQTMEAAFAAAGLTKPQALSVSQVDLARAGPNVPPAIRSIFRLTPGDTALAPAPGGGWFVAKLDRLVPGDPKLVPAIAAQTRSEMLRNLGTEYAQQFANAARAEVKIRRNPAAQARLEQQLRGTAPAGTGQ